MITHLQVEPPSSVHYAVSKSGEEFKFAYKVSDLRNKLPEWVEWVKANDPVVASLSDFTGEAPSLISVCLSLRNSGFEITYD